MKRENKRFLRLFFLMVLLAAIFVMPSVFAAEKNVDLTYEGEKVQNIVIDQDEKKVLYAETDIENASFQWQIMMNSQSETWVDIYDKTEASCELSYAVVKHMLNDSDSVYVRCKMLLEDEVVYSDFVTVTVNYIQEEIAQERKLDLSEYINVQDEIDTTVLNTNTFALLSADQEEDEEYVTITIKYLDIASLNGAEETAIYSPYIATIIKGSEFKQSVVSPTFLGFAPYFDTNNDKTINDNDASAQTVLCNYDAVNENIEIKIYYKPIKVNFAVKYFFQNINNDLYVEDATRYHSDQAETGTIVTNEYMEAKAGVTTGFTKMYHIPESVAADGSTVFECYYDRNYYLMQFDLNGGYGVDPLYARYETPFLVNDPIRHGYKFAGWKLSAVDMDGDGEWDDTIPTDISTELVSVIPAYNCQYQAQWETIETTATVVYWLEDPDIEGKYSYWKTEIIDNIVSGTTIYGKDYSDITKCDWYKNTENAEATYQFYQYNAVKTENESGVIAEGNGSSTINVYYDRKEYSLRFIFARTDGTNYQNASHTNSDDYVNVGWGNRTLNQTNWINVTNSSNPACKKFTENGWTYYYFEITDKFGARIDDEWVKINNLLANNQIVSDNIYVSWRTNSNSGYARANSSNLNIKGAYPYMDTQMIITNSSTGMVKNSTHTMTAYNNTGVSYYQYEIYFYDDAANEYKLENSFIVNPTAQYNQQSTFQYTGFNCVKTEYFDRDANGNLVEETNLNSRPNGKNSVEYPAIIKFYYEPKNYTLKFYNHNEFINDIGQEVTYGTLLSGYQPDNGLIYPDTLEKNAYKFEGWYTSPGCYDGTKVNWDTDTMPAQDFVLYANWVPETHKARFFTSYNDLTAYENNTSSTVYYSVDVNHGGIVGTVETPTRDGDGGLNLTFAGWFYMENGQKKAFSTYDIPVNKDMNIFAEWSSHSPQPYCVSYVLLSDPNTKVADDSKGYAYGGSTRTFNAKAGDPYNQLYSQYNKGYFPTVSSHSITIQAEADKDNLQHNIFTFYYVEAQSIEYTVRYVNKETNAVMDTITYTTSSSVVTERFKAYLDMVPDAFYKRLVLEVKWDEEANKYVGTDNNVVTFYYTPNTTSAYYAVHFMLEKLDATEAEKGNYAINGTGGYEETGTHIEGVGKVGSKVYIKPQEISGFKVIDNEQVPIVYDNGLYKDVANYSSENDGYEMQITENGAELYIFYERKDYPYTVNYYEYNTTKSLELSERGTADYGKEVTETAKKINGYTCVSSQTQTITIREESDRDAKLNVITFYYSPLQYVAEYVALPDDGGWLSNTIEVISGTEDLTGSVPTANQYYEFAGWYLDEACTQSVTAEYGTVDQSTNRFIPDKTKLSETERNIFYAKFVKKVGNLTIQRNNVQDLTQIFVYEIKNNSTNESIYVTIQGNGSATVYNLPLGEYTVKQQNGWSWRFEDAALSVDHQNAEGTTVTFSDSVKKEQWLNGNSTLIKNQWRQ